MSMPVCQLILENYFMKLLFVALELIALAVELKAFTTSLITIRVYFRFKIS